MANEALVNTVKQIVAVAREGNLDQAYGLYKDLFSHREFALYDVKDQRTALRLMILAKHLPPRPTPAMVEAHRSAVAPLTALVSSYQDPADHEMLGMCHVVLGNIPSAAEIFRAGLTIEREHNPQSNLCGSLMKRVSSI